MAKNKCDCSDSNCCGKGLGVVLIVLVAAILLAVSFTAGQLYSNDQNIIVSNSGENPNLKLLSSSGSVTKYVTPDKVDIVLSVETLDKSAQKSQSDNAVIADKVKGSLESLSSVRAEVKTLSYSLNEEFEWNDFTKKSESIGYRAINQIQVTLKSADVARAGTVIDTAVQSGANRVSSISFGLTDSKEMEIRQTALKEASLVAKAKANSIASGLGVSVGAAHTISESSFYYNPNYKSYDMAASNTGASASTPITAGDVEVTASVSVSFEIT